MNLIDENVEKASEIKQKRLVKFIIIAIVALVILAIIIVMFATVKERNTLTVSVNDENVKFDSDLFLMDNKNIHVEDNGQIYISVKKLANMLDVSFYNDEFKEKGEDSTKCYIKTENEYTSYITGSNEIYKVIDNKAIKVQDDKDKTTTIKNEIEPNDYEYEYFTVSNEVKLVDNEIYASTDAIKLGFNISLSYDNKSKSVKIITLDKLYKIASKKVGENLIVSDSDLIYYNKKLLKYGYALVKGENNEIGIANYINFQKGNYLVSCKYSEIKFIESINSIMVTNTNDNKVGIMKLDFNDEKNVDVILEPRFEKVYQMDKSGETYIVKENGRYGIVKIVKDESGTKTKTLLKSEYQYIGLEEMDDDIQSDSKFVIKDKYIPIKRDDKWGIASIDGTVNIIPQYDKIGCKSSESSEDIILLPELGKNGEIDGIVFGRNVENEDKTISTKYKIINAQNNAQIGLDAREIFVVSENNIKQYIMKAIVNDTDTMRVNIYDVYSTKRNN